MEQAILILIYSLSLLLYLVDVIKKVWQYKGVSYRLLVVGGLLQSLTFAWYIYTQVYFPLLTWYEVLLFYSLIFILIAITVHPLFNWELLEISMLFLGLVLLIGAYSIGETMPTIKSTYISKLLFIHVTFSIISYGAFTLSALFSVLYIIHEWLLKRKIWNNFTKMLPSLESLERNGHYASLLGTPMLFFGITVGTIWAGVFFKWTFFLDPKVLLSLVILGMYLLGMVKRRKGEWLPRQLAIWNLISFAVVMINFFVTSLLWSFHRWL